jgi:hypothetical protein
MEGTTQPGLTALGDEASVMLDGHDGQAVREQAVEDSEQGLHVEPSDVSGPDAGSIGLDQLPGPLLPWLRSAIAAGRSRAGSCHPLAVSPWP